MGYFDDDFRESPEGEDEWLPVGNMQLRGGRD
jgi:hypothetical protein